MRYVKFWFLLVRNLKMAKKKLIVADVARFRDPRDVPAYTVAEAAHYLSIPKSTVRSWIVGMQKFKSVIRPPVENDSLLSFFNLVEAHTLRSLRIRGIELPRIRRSLEYVKKHYRWERPLIQQKFMTDGVSLFIEHLGQTIDVGSGGQTVIREVMAHLERIEWEHGIAARLYPFTRLHGIDSPRSVIIDPRFSFGRPILKGARVATAILAERYKAGDSMDDLAQDYGCPRLEVEEAVRCELRIEVAA